MSVAPLVATLPVAAPSARSRGLFLSAVALAIILPLGFALYTAHVWEDFYITFRVSKNLVAGNGLVYQPGERVHTFTSPLGVLVPALCSWAAGTANDVTAIWLFRAIGVALFAGIAFLLRRIARSLELTRLSWVLAGGLLLMDAKITDFAMNGMETAILLFFFAWTIEAMLARARSGWRLGVGLGGLMWSRPDGFVFGGALVAGLLFLQWFRETPAERKETMRWLGRALGVAALIYLPWVLWAWSYYGSPIPNTIIAKSVVAKQVRSVGALFSYPLDLILGRAQLTQIFLPTYHNLGGWTPALRAFSVVLTVPAALYFLVPRARTIGRGLSLGLFLGGFYLQIAPPSPWYMQVWTLLAVMVDAVLLTDALRWLSSFKSIPAVGVRAGNRIMATVVALLIVTQAGIWVCAALQMRVQQREIELGVRQSIGVFLRQAAKPGDSVMLEPLGYVGYFSELKMLDFPGLSAPEVTRSLRAGANGWPGLITALQPDWLVMRPGDIAQISSLRPQLLQGEYQMVAHADVREKLSQYSFLPGRNYVMFDALYVVYRRVAAKKS